jgi:hypothetical protein
MTDNKNQVDVIQGTSYVPFEWRSLGAVFARNKSSDQALSARVNFVVRKGYDAVDDIEYGRVVEGNGAMGVTLKSKDYAFNLSATGISYKSVSACLPVEHTLQGTTCKISCTYQPRSNQKQRCQMHTALLGIKSCNDDGMEAAAL